MSIEVLDGEFSASMWMQAYGDSLVEAGLQYNLIEWDWQHFDWGTVLEMVFPDEEAWECFRANPAVQAALDAVPDRVSGLLIYRGRGRTSAPPRAPQAPPPGRGGSGGARVPAGMDVRARRGAARSLRRGSRRPLTPRRDRADVEST